MRLGHKPSRPYGDPLIKDVYELYHIKGAKAKRKVKERALQRCEHRGISRVRLALAGTDSNDNDIFNVLLSICAQEYRKHIDRRKFICSVWAFFIFTIPAAIVLFTGIK